MLTEISSGLYVRRDDIMSVTVYSGDQKSLGVRTTPHVVVRMIDNAWTWEFDTMDAAHAFAKRVVSKINEVAVLCPPSSDSTPTTEPPSGSGAEPTSP